MKLKLFAIPLVSVTGYEEVTAGNGSGHGRGRLEKMNYGFGEDEV